MNREMIRICNCLLLIVALSAFSLGQTAASGPPHLSGTYKLTEKANKAGQTQIELQLHVVNYGARDLHIQRITLWDFSHPSKGGTKPCSFVVHAAASANTTQEFTIPRAELDLWKRGARPRVVLALAMPDGHLSTAVVRLDRAPSGKGN